MYRFTVIKKDCRLRIHHIFTYKKLWVLLNTSPLSWKRVKGSAICQVLLVIQYFPDKRGYNVNMLLISQGKQIKSLTEGIVSLSEGCVNLSAYTQSFLFSKRRSVMPLCLKFFASLHCLCSLKSCDRMLTLSALNLPVKLCNVVSKAYKHLC